jgi:DeoR/GlpR family transcriptional regulator of sugar metabolism
MAKADESPVNAALRRDRVLAVIRERDFVRVGELSERFDVSEVTVRSDLDALAGRGEVHRIRGGAIPRMLPDKERMLRTAARRVVLADGSKIGRVELAHLCPIEDINLVITGESADRGGGDALRERGCEVRLVA